MQFIFTAINKRFIILNPPKTQKVNDCKVTKMQKVNDFEVTYCFKRREMVL